MHPGWPAYWADYKRCLRAQGIEVKEPKMDLTFKKLAEGLKESNKNYFPHARKWTGSDWMTALCGEVGEAANIIKKINRGDFKTEEKLAIAHKELSKEFADILMYLEHISRHYGIDLEKAVLDKFEEVMTRVDSDLSLREKDDKKSVYPQY